MKIIVQPAISSCGCEVLHLAQQNILIYSNNIIRVYAVQGKLGVFGRAIPAQTHPSSHQLRKS